MTSGPNVKTSFEKLFADTLTRVTLLERRLAQQGGGGGGGTVLDTDWVDISTAVTWQTGWSYVASSGSWAGVKVRRVGNIVNMVVANARVAAGTYNVPTSGNITNSPIFTNLPLAYRPGSQSVVSVSTADSGPVAAFFIRPEGGVTLSAVAPDSTITASTPNIQNDFSFSATYLVDGTFTTGTLNTLSLPAGLVFASPSPTITPSGTLLCDGSAVSRTTYAELFAMIGTTYGVGDGSTTFNLPNFRGRALVGQDTTQTEFDVVGETGGAKTHTLVTAEIPVHSHTFADVGNGYVWGWGSGGGNVHINVDAVAGPAGGNNLFTNQNAGNWYGTNNAGGGGAHNNLQPYAVVRWVITTGRGGGVIPTPDAPFGKGTTAQRNFTYGTPTNVAEQVALANSVPIWFNTELGWEESYYAVTGSAGLTVRGLLAGAAAGWYPTGPSLYANVRRNASQSIGTNADILFDTAITLRGIPFTGPASGYTLPYGGIWEFGATASAGQTANNYLNITLYVGGVSIVLVTGGAYPHTTAYSRGTLTYQMPVLTSGTVTRVNASASSAATIEATSAWFSAKYLGPPLVNG